MGTVPHYRETRHGDILLSDTHGDSSHYNVTHRDCPSPQEDTGSAPPLPPTGGHRDMLQSDTHGNSPHYNVTQRQLF
ncbi:hypothetical protein FKM82_008472 [Ascaphus truei]